MEDGGGESAGSDSEEYWRELLAVIEGNKTVSEEQEGMEDQQEVFVSN